MSFFPYYSHFDKSLREAYGDEILELSRKNPDIWVVDADVGKSCLTLDFAHELPDQYVNCGIAEQGWFGQSGPYEKLLEINGITKEDIVKTAEDLLG